jgi:serine/threonine protein phosphatase PrpC
MSSPRLVAGHCINHGRPDRLGFDAYTGHADTGIFVLCDGANSCPDSGKAALWLSQSLASDLIIQVESEDFEASLRRLHEDMLELFPITAATVLALRAKANGLTLASVGDSSLVVLKRAWAGWGNWRVVHEMPRDINEQGHPSQLLGSEVLDQIHQARLIGKGRYLTILMTDGVANTVSEAELIQIVSAVGRWQTPSSDDLDYLCQTLVILALDRGCQDDLSAVMIHAAFD